MNWYLAALKKYAVFSGRARRKENWMFLLYWFFFGLLAFVLDYKVLGTRLFLFCPLYLIATFLPSLALLVRRLHDIGMSGWFVLTPWRDVVASAAQDGVPFPMADDILRYVKRFV
jgi:uncharacterized membrane protein YhaH (DUF805 family)